MINRLFSGINCSQCGTMFDENSATVQRSDENLCVVQVVCPKCSKRYAMAFFGLDEKEVESMCAKKSYALNVTEEVSAPTGEKRQIAEEAITYDDVIEAHNFIENLGADWMKHLP